MIIRPLKHVAAPLGPVLQGGKTPGIVFSGPGGEQQLLAFESQSLAKLISQLGRTAWACSIFNLQIQGEDGSSQTVRALVRGGGGRRPAAAAAGCWVLLPAAALGCWRCALMF